MTCCAKIARLEERNAVLRAALVEMTRAAVALVEEQRATVVLNSEHNAISTIAKVHVLDCRIAYLNDRCAAALSDGGERQGGGLVGKVRR